MKLFVVRIIVQCIGGLAGVRQRCLQMQFPWILFLECNKKVRRFCRVYRPGRGRLEGNGSQGGCGRLASILIFLGGQLYGWNIWGCGGLEEFKGFEVMKYWGGNVQNEVRDLRNSFRCQTDQNSRILSDFTESRLPLYFIVPLRVKMAKISLFPPINPPMIPQTHPLLLQIKVNYKSTMIEQEQVFYSHEDPEWINKNRTLVVSSRGMTAQQRSFMLALFALMPHAKKDCKLEKHDVREQIAELCENFKTRYFMYFEVKRKVRYSLWVGKYPEGPSIKLDLENIVSLKDIRFQGNSVKGARHVLSFDGGFESGKFALLKEVFIGMLNVPKHHPKSTGVIDHVLNFATEKDSVSFRNYQIFREAVNKDKDKLDLFQVGPRFIMNINCILDGVMGGEVLYRAPVTKLIPKKSKLDKRTLINPTEVKPKNVFGEEQ